METDTDTTLPTERGGTLWGKLWRLLHDRRVSFLIVGGINTGVGYLVFAGLLLTLGRVIEPHLGKAFAALAIYLLTHVLTVSMAFILYRRFVFRVKGHVLRDLARFESVYVVSLSINSVSLPVLVGFFHLHALLAQAILTAVTATISYFGHRDFSFRRTRTGVTIAEDHPVAHGQV